MDLEEAICDRLTRLGVSEISLHALLHTLDMRAVSREANIQAHLGRTILWIAFTRKQAERHDVRLETYGKLSQSAPMLRFVSPEEVRGDLSRGWFGIAVNVADVVTGA